MSRNGFAQNLPLLQDAKREISLFWTFPTWHVCMPQIRLYAYVNQNFRRNRFSSQMKRKTRTGILLCSLLVLLGSRVINIFFRWLDWNSPYFTVCVKITRLRKLKQCSWEFSFFNINSTPTLSSFGNFCVQMHTDFIKVLCVSCQRRSKNIVYQHRSWFSWLLFFRHGLSGIQLIAFSAFSRLTEHEIYYNISYHIYPLSTGIEKGYADKIIPFFFCSV